MTIFYNILYINFCFVLIISLVSILYQSYAYLECPQMDILTTTNPVKEW